MPDESPFDPRMFLRRFHQNYMNFARLWKRLGRVPDGVALSSPDQKPIHIDHTRDASIDALGPDVHYVKFMRSINGKPAIVVEDESDLPPIDRIVVVTRTTSVVTADDYRVVSDVYIADRRPSDVAAQGKLMQVDYTFEGRQTSIEVTDGSAALPVIVLLHGTGGDTNDMTNPGNFPDHNYDYGAPFDPDQSIGWRVYPGIGIWSFALDPKKAVTSWQAVLSQNKFRTATYAQVDSTGLLARPAEELSEIMVALSSALPEAKFVLLGQSRGGVLIRKFLKDHPDRASRVTTVITLHAPHLGSRLASVAKDIDSMLGDLRQALGSVVDSLFGWLQDMVRAPAFQELAVGSAFLQDLAQGEGPLPGISYYTFGGTSVRVTRILNWSYTLDSATPQWHWPPFFHRLAMGETPVISPFANSVPNIVEELADGQGDLLTADVRTRLPFAAHHTNYINHAETLWDPRLQDQVLQILGVESSIWS